MEFREFTVIPSTVNTTILSRNESGTMMSWWAATAVPLDGEWPPLDLPAPHWMIMALVLLTIARFLHLFSAPTPPEVTYREKTDKGGIKQLMDGIAMLQEPYRAPSFWGRSGHIQTATYGMLGHVNLSRTADRRVAQKVSDGSTVTFDIFEPLVPHESGRDITLSLTPGIANSSESNYIRTLVHYAQEAGYRCVVLNHLGAMKDVPLTGARIFSYGGIEELTCMMDWMMHNYPNTTFIPIGFSMGGNLTTRYIISLKENREKCARMLMGLSVCQGYCAVSSTPMYHDWTNGRRAYNYIITENMKRLLRNHYSEAVEPHVKSGLVDEQRLWAATSIVALDEQYNRRVFGFSCLESFYSWCSCLHSLPDIAIPMIFLNAEDDPIIPENLWKPVRELASDRDDMAFILTHHGGHLGFLEGSSCSPNSVTWLDRFIVQMADSALRTFQ